MKVLICVPCMDAVQTSFFTSVLGLRYDPRHQYHWSVKCNSLVYNARNEMAMEAIGGGYDVMVSFDSDLVLPEDALLRLVGIIETGADFVTGLYFRRRLPTSPLILKALDWYEDEVLGAQEVAEVYEDYPRDCVFPVAGAGFGCCAVRVEAMKKVVPMFRVAPFTPMPRLSEDYSFCWRLGKVEGVKMVCDSGLKPGHAGLWVYGEKDWDGQVKMKHGAEE